MKKIFLTLAVASITHLSYAQFSTSGGNTTTMDNVGIGTTVPSGLGKILHLNSSGADAQFRITTSNSTSLSTGLLMSVASNNDGYFYNYENAGLQFGTNNTLRMTVLANGNVGIGTTSPISKLEVRTDGTGVNWAGKLALSNYTSDKQVFLGTYNGNSVVASHNFALNAWRPLYLNTVDGATGMVIQGNKTIGVNTSDPQAILHVAGASNNIGVGVQDGNDRPGLSVTGNYPQLVLMAGIANANHGSSISLGAFDSGSSGTFKSWTLGTPGNNATFMDIGYGTSTNPHFNGLAGFGTTVMRFTNNGNIGVGVTNPAYKLGLPNNATISFNQDPTNPFGIEGGDHAQTRIIMGAASGSGSNIAFGVSSGIGYSGFTEKMRINSAGDVSIGTTDSHGYKLAVNGNAIAESVTVKVHGTWPDYVFKPKYNLPSLYEVKTYIDKNQHLPDVPSEAEVAKNGINLSEMNKILVKKVEELTLYQIKQYEKSKQQEARIAKLEKALSKLTAKNVRY